MAAGIQIGPSMCTAVVQVPIIREWWYWYRYCNKPVIILCKTTAAVVGSRQQYTRASNRSRRVHIIMYSLLQQLQFCTAVVIAMHRRGLYTRASIRENILTTTTTQRRTYLDNIYYLCSMQLMVVRIV